MFRVKNVTLSSTPQELTFEDEAYPVFSIIITNTSANKHALVGNLDVSTTNFGFRVEHDQAPVTIENLRAIDHLYAISEDGSSVQVAVTVIERI